MHAVASDQEITAGLCTVVEPRDNAIRRHCGLHESLPEYEFDAAENRCIVQGRGGGEHAGPCSSSRQAWCCRGHRSELLACSGEENSRAGLKTGGAHGSAGFDRA
jgi:hypothetical protein